MTEGRPRYIPPAAGMPTLSVERLSFVGGLTWLGVGLAIVMAIIGLARIGQNRPVSCADDESGEACVVHPHALEGSVMIIVALLLGILVYVSCAILRPPGERPVGTAPL